MTAGRITVFADRPLASATGRADPRRDGVSVAGAVRSAWGSGDPDEGRAGSRGAASSISGTTLGLSEVLLVTADHRPPPDRPRHVPVRDLPPASDVPAAVQEAADVREHDDGWVAPFLRPVRGAVLDQEVFATRTGLELMRGLVSGELRLSPAALLLGARPIEAGEGTCTFSMPATGWLTSPTGLVLGGVTRAWPTSRSAPRCTRPWPRHRHRADRPSRSVHPPRARRRPPGNGTGHRGPPRPRLAAARAEVTDSEARLLALADAWALILPGSRADLSDAPPLG